MRTIAAALLALGAVLAVCLAPPPNALAGGIPFTVNNNGDNPDHTVGNGQCSANTATGGPCTLRAAIMESNVFPGSTISFAIAPLGTVPTIAPGGTGLPPVTAPTTINGTTQDAGRVEISGQNITGTNVAGLILVVANSTVRGLVINEFTGAGIIVNGPTATIANNRIGTNVAGNSPLGNGGNGIVVAGFGSTIGPNNIVGGNGLDGILVLADSVDVEGNRVGLSGSDGDVGNGKSGIHLSAVDDTTVGGPNPADLNRIGNNDDHGVLIDGASTLNVMHNNRIGDESINPAGNAKHGIMITGGAHENFVIDNFVGGSGMDGIHIEGAGAHSNFVADNTFDSPANALTAIAIIGAPDSTIGLSGGGNFVGPTGLHGILISGAGASGNVVEGNRFGGTFGGPQGDGVRLENGAHDNDIDDNTFFGGGGDGIALLTGAHNNNVRSNVIGVPSPFSGEAVGVAGAGILIDDSPNNRIGGPVAEDRNFILDSDEEGIRIEGAAATGNVIDNISIGIEEDGDIAGNAGAGIAVLSASGNTIGESQTTYIGGNGGGGIFISDSEFTAILETTVGETLGGAAAGNAGDGIELDNATNTLIGFLGDPVTVVNNTGAGIRVSSGSGNIIQSTEVSDNGGLGIDLGRGGVTDNDPGDVDSGANALQNFPVLANGPDTTPASFHLIATVDGFDTLEPMYIQVFANAECDPSGHGEGRDFLGQFSVTTDNSGHAEASIPLPDVAGLFITSTATNVDDGNTSEFSECLLATTEPPTGTPSPSPTEGSGTPTVTPPVTPTVTPTATPTGEPTATPSGAAIQGDVTCDGEVTTDDAMVLIADEAGFDTEPDGDCADPIAERGNVDCNETTDLEDALAILFHVAAMPKDNGACADIGSPIA